MYITNTETAAPSSGIIAYMPRDIRGYLYNINLCGAQEIRMRLGMPLSIHFSDGCRYIGRHGNLTAIPSSALRITRGHIDEAIEKATASSVYSVKDEIKNGFVTVRGGHRIGITGTAVVKNGEVEFIKDISALNFRLASEVRGAADAVISAITDGRTVKNTLLISPPAAGKTTMLRDAVRQLSYMGFRVSVVDERREIAALADGKSPFDLGFNTDVLEGADKAWGMLTVLRSMSPDVIVTDEIGTQRDIDAIERISNSGTAVLASVHGRNFDMIKRRVELNRMINLFDTAVVLSRRNGAGTVEEILTKW